MGKARSTRRAGSLAGLWGDSDRPDFRRLYLTSDLEVYAEFRVEDVLATVEIPPEPDVAVVPDALERVTDREGS